MKTNKDNKQKYSTGSKHYGVYMKPQGGYTAQICNNNKQYNLGTYKDDTHAAFAVNIGAEILGKDKRNTVDNTVIPIEVQSAITEKVKERIEHIKADYNKSKSHQGQQKKSEPTSKYAGIIHYSKENVYVPMITKDGQKYKLGYYPTEDMAAYAYNVAALNLYKDKDQDYRPKLHDVDIPGKDKEMVMEKVLVRIEEVKKGYSQSQSKQGVSKNRKSPLTSTYTGVSVYNNSFVTFLAKDGTNIYIGCFKDEDKAAAAYNIAAKHLYGKDAKVNKGVPESLETQDLANKIHIRIDKKIAQLKLKKGISGRMQAANEKGNANDEKKSEKGKRHAKGDGGRLK